MPNTKSHVNKSGEVFYEKTGRYNELTRDASHQFHNDAAPASEQGNLAPKGKHSAAAIIVRNVKKDL